MSDLAYAFDAINTMLDAIGVSKEEQAEIYRTYEPPRIQRHAAQTIFCMQTADHLRSPVAWFKASIRGNWGPPPGFDAEQQVMHFRVDEGTWVEFQRIAPCPICAGEHPKKDCPTTRGANA
jgi:hypothetical protein